MKILPEIMSALRPFVEERMTTYAQGKTDAERENYEELAYSSVLKELAHEIIEALG